MGTISVYTLTEWQLIDIIESAQKITIERLITMEAIDTAVAADMLATSQWGWNNNTLSLKCRRIPKAPDSKEVNDGQDNHCDNRRHGE